MGKNIYIIGIILFAVIGGFFLISNIDIEAKYNFVGKFSYRIEDEKEFRRTYLYNSLGYTIGDLSIPGVRIIGIEALDPECDYIVSLNYPIKKVYKNSDVIRNEGMEHTSKRPLEIILDLDSFSNHIYIYQLIENDKYRLLLP